MSCEFAVLFLQFCHLIRHALQGRRQRRATTGRRRNILIQVIRQQCVRFGQMAECDTQVLVVDVDFVHIPDLEISGTKRRP